MTIPGFGTWYGKADEEEASRTLTYAADRGITFWDTSDAYEASAYYHPLPSPHRMTNCVIHR